MNHLITPPPELRRQWLDDDHFSMVTGTHDLMSITRDWLNSVMDQSAQWGADQELEACLRYAGDNGLSITRMRAARRPKPPSLKEQALAVLDDCSDRLEGAHENTIRRALEALDG